MTKAAQKSQEHNDPSVEKAVGAQVKQLRNQLGVTARELAALAGLSVSALSKIENGRISPSLSALLALSRALNVPLATLFSQFDKNRESSFVPAGEGMHMERRGTREGHQYYLLGKSTDGPISFEPYLITIEGNPEPYTSFRHDGIEFIHMLSGSMVYQHGSNLFEMKRGDSLTFDSASSHGPAQLKKTPCRYISIIVSLRHN